MAEKREVTSVSTNEKVWKFGRDINALGAIAIAGVALAIPGPNIVLVSWAGVNAAQAGGFEFLRRHSHTKNISNSHK